MDTPLHFSVSVPCEEEPCYNNGGDDECDEMCVCTDPLYDYESSIGRCVGKLILYECRGSDLGPFLKQCLNK